MPWWCWERERNGWPDLSRAGSRKWLGDKALFHRWGKQSWLSRLMLRPRASCWRMWMKQRSEFEKLHVWSHGVGVGVSGWGWVDLSSHDCTFEGKIRYVATFPDKKLSACSGPCFCCQCKWGFPRSQHQGMAGKLIPLRSSKSSGAWRPPGFTPPTCWMFMWTYL